MSSGCMPPYNAWASRASTGPGGATGIGSSSRGTESALPLPTVMDVTEQPSLMTSNLATRMAQPLTECAPRELRIHVLGHVVREVEMCRRIWFHGRSGTGDGRSGRSHLTYVYNLLRGLPQR